MLKGIIFTAFCLMLAGCVDLGAVGSNPSVKQVYFNADSHDTYLCLDDEATRNNLTLEEDTQLPSGERKFYLKDQSETLAWVDMSSTNNSSTVDIFYNKEDVDLVNKVDKIIENCHNALD
ncbi:TPA: hypothetical protein SLG40_003214 [Serratia odorifera]|nr:hypothetical protein [Serratia odorifera]